MLNDQKKLGKGMIIMAWVLGLLLLTWYFNHRNATQENPNQNLATTGQTVILQRNASHHYVFTGSINNQSTVFLLDTGATDVTIPQKLAQQLALKKGYPYKASTANGTITVYATIIETLSLGSIVLHNVRAVINPSMGGNEVLLGMSALKNLQFSQKGEQLTIKN
jgi:aspartyl protease family protein